MQVTDASVDFRALRKRKYDSMLDTENKRKKYKSFLFALRTYKYIPSCYARGDFLENYYVLMRYIDDVVDRDTELPPMYSSVEEFIEQKIKFAKDPINPKDDGDSFMSYCFGLASVFGENFADETLDILESMRFDAERYGKREALSDFELKKHFHVLDVRGTIKATLKVFGEDPMKYTTLAPLGFASRIHYNLRDYEEDIEKGFVNISAEDCKRLGISAADLEGRLSPGVQTWFGEQAMEGMALLDKHREAIGTGRFGLVTRMTLPVVYERPARRYFKRVLDGAA